MNDQDLSKSEAMAAPVKAKAKNKDVDSLKVSQFSPSTIDSMDGYTFAQANNSEAADELVLRWNVHHEALAALEHAQDVLFVMLGAENPTSAIAQDARAAMAKSAQVISKMKGEK